MNEYQQQIYSNIFAALNLLYSKLLTPPQMNLISPEMQMNTLTKQNTSSPCTHPVHSQMQMNAWLCNSQQCTHYNNRAPIHFTLKCKWIHSPNKTQEPWPRPPHAAIQMNALIEDTRTVNPTPVHPAISLWPRTHPFQSEMQMNTRTKQDARPVASSISRCNWNKCSLFIRAMSVQCPASRVRIQLTAP